MSAELSQCSASTSNQEWSSHYTTSAMRERHGPTLEDRQSLPGPGWTLAAHARAHRRHGLPLEAAGTVAVALLRQEAGTQ